MKNQFLRREFIATIASTLTASLLPTANAQGLGGNFTKLIIPYAPGGAADVLTRLLAERMAQSLGKSVIFDYKPGANGVIASEYIHGSQPDASQILVGSLDSVCLNPFLYRNLKFKTSDLVPIAQTSRIPLFLIGQKKLGVTTISELVTIAKTRSLNYSSWGNGSMAHVGMELFRQRAKVKLTHVPYKGAAPAVLAVLSGEVDLMLAPASLVNAHRANLINFGVASQSRFQGMSDVPTLKETGLELETDTWNGLFAPPGTPGALADAISKSVLHALGDPAVAEKLVAGGASVPTVKSRSEFSKLVIAETGKWGPIIKAADIRLD